MVVLGAGGAATAIQVQCALDGAESISIFNPKDPFFARAESTAEKLSKETPDCKVSVFDLADEAKLKEEVAKRRHPRKRNTCRNETSRRAYSD